VKDRPRVCPADPRDQLLLASQFGSSPLLLLSQVYPPDPTSLGQHLHDAARELARRGHPVQVFTSDRGFADPSRRYPRRETLDGVEVRRLAWGSFGKSSLTARSAGGLVFLAQAVLLALTTLRGSRRPAGILVSTSPPMAPVAGLLLSRLLRAPLVLWLMDLNPDQAIAVGAVKPTALSARLLERANRAAARGAAEVVVLDEFMAARVARWAPRTTAILPPWPHEDHIAPVAHADNPFRQLHNPDGRRVVAYSGNLSPVHPLDTILDAAVALRDDPRLRFLFIGAGGQRALVEETIRREGLNNVTLLPYQPLDQLRYSLSAADVHLVSMGADMVGIVHPCKVYGAMAAARPILYLGPQRSHVGELLRRHDMGWQVDHGDVAGAVAALREIAAMPDDALTARGFRASAALAGELSQASLLGRFADLVEGALAPIAAPAAQPGDP
jgi:colanic acid biosynthesis glycosyl transferase WcaI